MQHCVDIAKQALRDGHTQLSHAWLKEASHRLASENSFELQPQIEELLGQVRARLTGYGAANETLRNAVDEDEFEEHAVSCEYILYFSYHLILLAAIARGLFQAERVR